MPYKAMALCLATMCVSTAYAAPAFDPQNEPQVWLAPIALSNTDLRPVPDIRPEGGAQGFRPWFENGAWQGDLIELDISATGITTSTVNLIPTVPTTPDGGNWSARIQFNNASNNNENRNIVIGNGNGTSASRFRLESLSEGQQSAILSNAQTANIEQIVNFIRGDRSNEQSPDNPTGDLRRRLNVLGDIIHSPPKYVAAPDPDLIIDNYPPIASYPAFAAANRNRAPRVYVGANDGMLHAFDATSRQETSGDEIFAYIPSMVTKNLGLLTRRPYRHTYFVDGQIATGNVFFDGAWHTVLVGGLGAGGKGFFALDITDAEVSSESEVANNKFLWEVNASDPDIGFSYSRPTIALLNDDKWYAVVGNGYNSADGKAKLLLINIENGDVTELETDNSGTSTETDGNGNITGGNPNGLSSPSLIDTNGDGKADVAYAGDINGNLWKFDLTGNNPTRRLLWLDDEHPIIIPPDVVPNPAIDGHFVYVGTGRAFTALDLADSTTQSLYGAIDFIDDDSFPGTLTADNTTIVDQNLRQNAFNGQPVRTTTTRPVTSQNRGWRINFSDVSGERFLTEIQTRAGRVQGLTFNPIPNTRENWLTQPAFDNGGAPRTTILDLNGDGNLTTNDHVDGDGIDGITGAQEDIPMGLFLGTGIRSRPTIAVINRQVDTALINGLFVSTIQCPERFQDICLGRFSDLDDVEDEFNELQREINDLNDILTRLGEELGQLEADRTTLQEALDQLNADPSADPNDILNAEQALTDKQQDIDANEAEKSQTEQALSELRAQEQQAIDFRNELEEDIRLRETGGSRDISNIDVAGIRSLGPNFALGRHSWVELELE